MVRMILVEVGKSGAMTSTIAKVSGNGDNL